MSLYSPVFLFEVDRLKHKDVELISKTPKSAKHRDEYVVPIVFITSFASFAYYLIFTYVYYMFFLVFLLFLYSFPSQWLDAFPMNQRRQERPAATAARDPGVGRWCGSSDVPR